MTGARAIRHKAHMCEPGPLVCIKRKAKLAIRRTVCSVDMPSGQGACRRRVDLDHRNSAVVEIDIPVARETSQSSVQTFPLLFAKMRTGLAGSISCQI